MSIKNAVRVVSAPMPVITSDEVLSGGLEMIKGRLDGVKVMDMELEAAALDKSHENPLWTMAALAGLSSEDAAALAGVTVVGLHGGVLQGNRAQAERGLGRMALALLARLRNERRRLAFGKPSGLDENVADAADSYAVTLWNQRARARAAQ